MDEQNNYNTQGDNSEQTNNNTKSGDSEQSKSLIDSIKSLSGVIIGFCFLAGFAYGVLYLTSSNRALGDRVVEPQNATLADTLAGELGLKGASISRFKRLYERYAEQKNELMKYWKVEFESVLTTEQLEILLAKEDSIRMIK